jgi:hypothetical protein
VSLIDERVVLGGSGAAACACASVCACACVQDKNPVDNTRFFRESTATESFMVPRHKVSYILPTQVLSYEYRACCFSLRGVALTSRRALVLCRQFEERVLRVYSRSSDLVKVKAIQVWCTAVIVPVARWRCPPSNWPCDVQRAFRNFLRGFRPEAVVPDSPDHSSRVFQSPSKAPWHGHRDEGVGVVVRGGGVLGGGGGGGSGVGAGVGAGAAADDGIVVGPSAFALPPTAALSSALSRPRGGIKRYFQGVGQSQSSAEDATATAVGAAPPGDDAARAPTPPFVPGALLVASCVGYWTCLFLRVCVRVCVVALREWLECCHGREWREQATKSNLCG